MRTPSGQRPTPSDYQSAVACLEQRSKDPLLKRCRPRLGSDGQPGSDGGSFGTVYPLEDPESGRLWALKCFNRDEPHREKRYREIANCLHGARGSWHVEVRYLHEGLWVQERWWPVVLMEWVPGKRLTDWIDQLLDRRQQDAAGELRRLAHRFASAVYQMHRSGISHGDLQSGNVLVTASTSVRFVDYDAMTVPAWSLPPRREDGHPDFRLPREGERGPDGATQVHHTDITGGTVFTSSTSNGIPIQEPDALVAMHRDRFPSHVIHTALVMLSHDLSLWEALHQHGSDHLLLSRKDFRDPVQSRNWQALLDHGTDEVRVRARQLLALLHCPADLQPDLEPQPEVTSSVNLLELMAYRPTTGPRSGPRPFLDIGIFPAPDGPKGPGPGPAAEPSAVPAGEPAVAPASERDPARAAKPPVAPTAEPDPGRGTEPAAVPLTERRPGRAAEPAPVPATEPAPVRGTQPPVAPAAEPAPVRAAEPPLLPATAPSPRRAAEPPGVPVTEPDPVRAAKPPVVPTADPGPGRAGDPGPVPVQPDPPRPARVSRHMPAPSATAASAPARDPGRSTGYYGHAGFKPSRYPADPFADYTPLPSSRLTTGARITLVVLSVLFVVLVVLLLVLVV
ncbi:hypothetical protein [Streptomyces sp. NPDC093094]|uniref:protein kinase domain-containing protein n=1 Tax=Streptomyces sp. NPDC093094 TaxID=3366026 RepID=UPI0037F198FC